MKIGVITFHDTANYGAAFQAYATQFALKKLGHDVEVLDYTNNERKIIYNPYDKLKHEISRRNIIGIVKTILRYLPMKLRYRKFQAFYQENMLLSPFKINSQEEFRKVNSRYDVLLTGSDQIWNINNNYGDLNYLLDFADDDVIKISYASSLGMSGIPSAYLSQYKKCLSRFNHLSTREESGRNIIGSLLNKNVEVVLDPVFLLSKEDWISLIGLQVEPQHLSHPSGVVLDYCAHKGVSEKLLNLIREDNNLEFNQVVKYGTNISFYDLFKFKYRIRVTSGPEDFLRSLIVSDFVITTSFHAVVFSVIFEKQFVVAITGNEGRDSRIIDLLKSLGLESKVYNCDDQEVINLEPIDYAFVKPKINQLIENSYRYLEHSLSNEK